MAITENSGVRQSSQTRPGRLAVWTDHAGSRCSLIIRGELVADTIAELEEHLDLIVCCKSDHVVVDLSRLAIIDATGARVLVGLQHYVKGRGGQLDIVGADWRTTTALQEATADLAS